MIKNVVELAKYLEHEVRKYVDVAVVGISGGVDSATVASISVSALGVDNVYVLSMPYNATDIATFNRRSQELADVLGIKNNVVDISAIVDALNSSVAGVLGCAGDGDCLAKLTSGNGRARVRMSTLYGVAGELGYRFAGKKRVRVMGTGNASEDLLGYDTKGGDALADIFPIGELFKSEVYQLARYYGVPRSILDAPPSAGLYEGQTDAGELGYEYDELEKELATLQRCLSAGVADSELMNVITGTGGLDISKVQFVVGRFLANAHKHRASFVVRASHLREA